MDGQKNTTLSWALRYLDRGWSIIPVGQDKKPLPGIRWGRYQKTPASRQRIRQWFTDHNDAGIAVILGPVSGNLACRDFDEPGAYEHWAQAHAELARTLLDTGAVAGLDGEGGSP